MVERDDIEKQLKELRDSFARDLVQAKWLFGTEVAILAFVANFSQSGINLVDSGDVNWGLTAVFAAVILTSIITFLSYWSERAVTARLYRDVVDRIDVFNCFMVESDLRNRLVSLCFFFTNFLLVFGVCYLAFYSEVFQKASQ